MKLIPAPEREAYEREIQELLRPLRISEIARLIQRDSSAVSRAFNPFEPDRHNPFFEPVLHLWAIDALSGKLGDLVVAKMLGEREKWLGGKPVVAEHPATINSDIGRELFEAMEYEMRDADIDEQIREWNDVRNRVTSKINGLIAKRAVEKFGIPSNVTEMARKSA